MLAQPLAHARLTSTTRPTTGLDLEVPHLKIIYWKILVVVH